MDRPDERHGEPALDELVARLEAFEAIADPHERARVLSVLEAFDGLHRRALTRLFDAVRAAEPGLAARLYGDPDVRVLFDLYDLPPPDVHAAAAAAIDEVRPYAQSHGGDLELLGVQDGVVRVRLAGSCVGCPSSAATLRHWVEARLAERVPGYRGMEVVEAGHPGEPPRRLELLAGVPPAGPARIPLEEVRDAQPEEEVRVGRLSELGGDGLHGVRAGGLPVLLVRRGTEVRAFVDGCGGSPLLLSVGGSLEGDEIRCAWHGCRYDARTGAAIAARGGALPPLRVRVAGDDLWVAVPASRARPRGGAA